MKILMISGDNRIMDVASEAHQRMRSYASVCDELHIVVLIGTHGASRAAYGNLFLYPATGNVVMRRLHAYRIARSLSRRGGSGNKTTGVHPDVVSAQSPDELGLLAYMIARRLAARLQLQLHTDICSPWYRRAGIIPRVKYMLARLLLPRADCIRAVSRRIARSLADVLHIPESRITVLPLYTDRRNITREQPRGLKNPRRDQAVCSMIAVGRFVDKEKNFSMLIRAMTRLVTLYPTAILTIVGDGPDREYYQSLISVFHLERNVLLTSWQNTGTTFYESFDLLVIPSYIEGWGRVGIEAMASGVPVLMTDVGLAGEVVHDGVNGRVVPVADQESLIEALIDCCANPEKRIEMGRAARETIISLAPRTWEEYLIKWRKSFDCCRSSKSPQRL